MFPCLHGGSAFLDMSLPGILLQSRSQVTFRHIQGPGATVLSIGLALLMAALCVSLCVFVLDILLPRAHVLNSLAIFPSPWQSLSAHIPNLTDMSETTKKTLYSTASAT
jgi:hypothetical protein